MPAVQPAKMNRMKIADLSAASGLKKPTIHSYLKMGLLPPAVKVGPNLHLYDQDHLVALSRIRILRERDKMSLTEIRNLLARENARQPEPAPDAAADPGSGGSAQAKLQPSSYRQDEVIDVAIELFCQRGYADVKVADVTDALKMGKGSFYLYFKNKRELLLACFKKLAVMAMPLELREQIKSEDDFAARMKKRWEGFQSQYRNFNRLLHLLRSYVNAEDPTIRENARKAYKAIVKPLRIDIEEAIEKGVVRQLDPELTAYALLGAAEHAAFALSLDDSLSFSAASEITGTFVRSILVTPPAVEDGG